MWFGPIGMIVTVVSGKLISFFMGNRETENLDLVYRLKWSK